MTTTIAPFEDAAGDWERALYAFLAEKQHRTGSCHTAEGYSRMLPHFFGRLGKTPDQVTAREVFAYAHGIGLSGRRSSPVTIGARLAWSAPSTTSSSAWRSSLRTPWLCPPQRCSSKE